LAAGCDWNEGEEELPGGISCVCPGPASAPVPALGRPAGRALKQGSAGWEGRLGGRRSAAGCGLPRSPRARPAAGAASRGRGETLPPAGRRLLLAEQRTQDGAGDPRCREPGEAFSARGSERGEGVLLKGREDDRMYY